jgi:hypothetical protein
MIGIGVPDAAATQSLLWAHLRGEHEQHIRPALLIRKDGSLQVQRGSW